MLYTAIKKALLRVGLTGPVFLQMIKGALPPTIAIAMYRSKAVARVYGNFGFLIALSSILALHLQPRARFQQNLVLATVLTCLASAVAILSHFAGLKAREHTEVVGESRQSYNSSASVVNAIFLCFVIWLISSLRCAWPQVTIPFLVCTIYSIVAISNGPEVASEHNSLVLCKQLLFCYLTGFGISTAVSLLFFPKTSRSVFIDGSHRFVVQCRDLLRKERDMLKPMRDYVDSIDDCKEEQTNQSTVVKMSAMNMLGSMSSLREELSYARQEIAFGTFSYDGLESLLHHLESLMIPLLGLSKISSFKILSWQDRNRLSAFKNLAGAAVLIFETTIEELDSGLQYTELLSRSNGIFSSPAPIPADFNRYKSEHEEKPRNGMDRARSDLASKVFDLDEDDAPLKHSKVSDPELLVEVEEYIYILCLLQSASAAAQELSTFVRSQLVNGTTRRRRLIIPKIINFPFLGRISNRNQSHSFHGLDPEHLPPRNTVEKFGNRLRGLLSVLGSDSSKFGLRLAAATMSIGIMAFLKSTQHFYVEYRLVWATVMIPISMSPTAGTAIYGFIGRALGVTAAMLLAYINWYIVDGKTGGVVVMFFVSMMIYYFLLLRYPRFIVLFILAAANHVLIIGYELQVSVSVPGGTVSPQKYFPVYTLAPYRLLCVLAGLFVAFVFTLFPAQISEHKILRINVGKSLALLASYSSSVSATLDQRIRGLEGDISQASSPGRVLKARRNNILFQKLALLTTMRQISTMVPWEVSLGGKFPKNSYDRLVDEMQSAVASLSVIAYISQTFPSFVELPSNEVVRRAYASSLFHPTSSEVANILSLLALSLSNGSQLTPGVQVPAKRHQLLSLTRGADRQGVDVLNDPNLEAFVVVEIASAQLVRSLATMVSTVRELVGTMDFGAQSGAISDENTSTDMV